jgi:surfactin synthase thioesterase subunit
VDPEIIDMMIPTIQGDYEVFETYDMSDFGSPVISCPLTLFLPKRDSSVEADVALGWEENTTEEFTLVEFPEGGHFYLTDNGTKEEFYKKLIEECEKHVVSVWSCALN